MVIGWTVGDKSFGSTVGEMRQSSFWACKIVRSYECTRCEGMSLTAREQAENRILPDGYEIELSWSLSQSWDL